MYDPKIGRWFGVDPLAEKYYSTSPYAYCGNNPIVRIDLDGRRWIDGNGNLMWENGGFTETAMSSMHNQLRTAIQELMSTAEGMRQFNLLVNSPHNFLIQWGSTSGGQFNIGEINRAWGGDAFVFKGATITIDIGKCYAIAAEHGVSVEKLIALGIGHEVAHGKGTWGRGETYARNVTLRILGQMGLNPAIVGYVKTSTYGDTTSNKTSDHLLEELKLRMLMHDDDNDTKDKGVDKKHRK